MFERTKINENVYILKDRAGCCMNLIIGKEKALLFDTGVGLDPIEEEIRKITSLPLTVILSHGHYDHSGGSYQFPTVYMAKEDFTILEDYTVEILHSWLSDLTGQDEKELYQSPPAEWKCWKTIDFDEVDLGGLIGNIIPLRGHSAGSIGILFSELKLLLSGDALTPIMTMMFQNHTTVAEYRKTLEMVQHLDFENYLTSHHENTFPKALLSRMIDCLDASGEGRKICYRYPNPPYTDGGFYLHSMEDEPVAVILPLNSLLEHHGCEPMSFS